MEKCLNEHLDKIIKDLDSISDEELQDKFDKAKGGVVSRAVFSEKGQYNNLISAMEENDLLEEAVHLLIEAKERLHLIDRFNDLNSIDSAYANTTIDKISKFLGENE